MTQPRHVPTIEGAAEAPQPTYARLHDAWCELDSTLSDLIDHVGALDDAFGSTLTAVLHKLAGELIMVSGAISGFPRQFADEHGRLLDTNEELRRQLLVERAEVDRLVKALNTIRPVTTADVG